MNFTNTLLVILCMLILNAIFAAYEMALAAVSAARLAGLAQQKRKGSKDAAYMKDRMEASLAVIQVGITVVGAIAAATGGAGADEAFAPYFRESFGLSHGVSEFLAMVLVIIPLSAFTIIFGELVPKTFALNNREWVCLKLSPFMRVLYEIFYPVVFVFERTVKIFTVLGSKRLKQLGNVEPTHIHELKAAASMARTSRLIGARQERIVHSATELSVRAVKDILIPASDICMIMANLSLGDALIRAHMDMHTRFPVCTEDGNPQTITGYVNFKDIIFALHANPADPTLRGITRPIRSVNAKTKNSVVLEEMIQGAAHIALVSDDAGKVIGLVTLEDILEELVGEIQDEFDRLPNYVHPYLSGWIMGGGVAMNLVASTTGVLQSFEPSALVKIPTLAEWLVMIKGGPLRAGEVIEKDGLSIIVRKLRRKQLSEAFVSPKSSA